MANNNIITVKDVNIRTMKKDGVDYICITDIARQKNSVDPNGVIGNWMRNRNTIEYLGLWETLYNPNFNPLEFEGFRSQAGLNAHQRRYASGRAACQAESDCYPADAGAGG